MRFQPVKCNMMQLTRKRIKKIHASYTLEGTNLENVESIKYHGVTITSDLRWNTHVSNVCTKANRTLGFLRRNLHSCPQEVKEAAYKGFNDNIYHEGNIPKMPDFDVFSLLEIRKRKSRSHGIRKKGNGKRKKRAVKRSNTSLKDLSKVLEDHGRHSMLSFLSSLPISVLRILDTEANKFYDRNH